MTGYRLRPVQAQRERDEQRVRGALADAVGDASAAEARLAAASQRVAALREAIRHSPATTTTTIAELTRLEHYRARLRGQLELALVDELRARDARDGKTASVERARDRLALAKAARRVVEAHFARWRDDQRKLAERRED